MTNQKTAIVSTAAVDLGSTGLRFYPCDGRSVSEHCSNGKNWTLGAFNAPAEHVSATAVPALRVFCTHDGFVREWIYTSDFGWVTGSLEHAMPLPNGVIAKSTAAVSWTDSWTGKPRLRLYTCDGHRVTERCFDGKEWTQGSFSQPGELVTATVFAQKHLRVYCTNNNVTTEWCYDSDSGWHQGELSIGGAGQGGSKYVSTAAISWTSGVSQTPHIRLYVSDGTTVSEYGYDGSRWGEGGFSKPGHVVAATRQFDMKVYCSTGADTQLWIYEKGWKNGNYVAPS